MCRNRRRAAHEALVEPADADEAEAQPHEAGDAQQTFEVRHGCCKGVPERCKRGPYTGNRVSPVAGPWQIRAEHPWIGVREENPDFSKH